MNGPVDLEGDASIQTPLAPRITYINYAESHVPSPPFALNAGLTQDRYRAARWAVTGPSTVTPSSDVRPVPNRPTHLRVWKTHS